MASLTINPVNISANVEKDSASHPLTAKINSALIQLTDSTGATTPAAGSNWLTTAGNITQWGVQISSDNGTTWQWLVSQSLPFGSLDKSGNMPALAIQSGNIVGDVGNLVRLGILTDTAIRLGAVVTTN